MKKALFAWIFVMGLAQGAISQVTLETTEALSFGSEEERGFWIEGQTNPLALFRAVAPNSLADAKAWEELIADLDQKAEKKVDSMSLLRAIIQKSHQKLLKKYELHSTFNAMLSEGKYDCVSGSAALGILLDRYGYRFDIVETDYHVFLVVDLEGKNIVIESTLPIGGLITSPSEVSRYLDSYKPGETPIGPLPNQRLAGIDTDYSDNSIFRVVNLRQLAGLQYYNDAIVHFNSQAFKPAVEQLSKAYLLYPSDRILGLRELSIELAFRTYGYDLKK